MGNFLVRYVQEPEGIHIKAISGFAWGMFNPPRGAWSRAAPPQRMDERGILSDVRHLLRKSQFLGFVSVNYH